MLLYPNLLDSVIIDGVEYKVNTKYYIILKVLEYSNNPDFSDAQKVVYCLKLFYKKVGVMTYLKLLKQCGSL